MIFLSSNLSFAQENPTCTCTDWTVNSCPTTSLGTWTPGSNCTCSYGHDIITCTDTAITQDCNPACTGSKQCVCQQTGCTCTTPTTDTSSSTSVMGITCGPDELVNGQCKLNIYQTLGIRKTNQSTSVGLFVQDIVLSATFFIGTLVTVALIVSWLMFIFASSSGKDPQKARQGIIGSLLGLLIVVSSYVIIRLVQYIAKGF